MNAGDIQNRIFSHILEEILAGRIVPEQRLPTEVEYAGLFSTTRMNAHFALRKLEQAGIIERKRRSGSFLRTSVAHQEILSLAQSLTKRYCILASPPDFKIHWNESSLEELETSLAADGSESVFRELPEPLSRELLGEILAKAEADVFGGIILLPSAASIRVFSENPDLFISPRREFFLFDNDSGRMGNWQFHSLRLDTFGEGVAAGQFLARKNPEKIVFMQAHTVKSLWMEKRFAGLKAGFKSVTGSSDNVEKWECESEEELASALEAVKVLREKTALVAQNDGLAARLIDLAKTLGMAVPEDFEIIGFDNDFKFRSYNLTTVAPPLNQVGRMLAELVNSARREGVCRQLVLKSQLIVRETCPDAQKA
jgi:DNA-binding LacI/PurR family transcriptional regulator